VHVQVIVDRMLQTQVLSIAAPDGGGHLAVIEKRPPQLDPRLPPLLIAHGATFGGSLFDLPRAGYSLLAALAAPGRAVYALDIRGYGRSVAPQAMDSPPDGRPPFARAGAAALDVATTADFILARHARRALDIAGFSWGTIVAAKFASAHPDRVARMALYAPLYAARNEDWLDRIAEPADGSRLASTYGAYRLISAADVVRRWNGDLPEGDAERFREPDIADVLFDTQAALDPTAASRSPPAFRCPNGALADMVEVFNARPLYDPARLSMPVLLVRGAADTTSTDADCRTLLARIASRDKRYEAISPGSHFLCIERNRAVLYDCLQTFFARSDGTGVG
jgi:pimeloyl-ACP methyl ester carboxylesterase